MKIDVALKVHIERAFAPLNSQAAANAFPSPRSLSLTLEKASHAGTSSVLPSAKTPPVVRMFTTAAVDMWLRAVHSFLISTALTNISPIWASATGYYSSHYAVRSIAHLLGFFQMHRIKKIVRLELQNGVFVCSLEQKKSVDREHKFYWGIVKACSLFSADPFFTNNIGDESDVAHRDIANYADHLAAFPAFRPLNENDVKRRIRKISEIEVKAPPIPQRDTYPDIDSVQIVAYHRLVRFRDLVDAVVVGNRFWKVYRDPTWARQFMDFQVTEEATLRSAFTA